MTAVPVELSPRRPTRAADAPELLPLDAGEQYRFAFDVETCIGCHSCEVACAEQNGNPTSVNWRKVGEVEAGVFPTVRRFSLSMACHHCLEPACLSGCPTNAYVKLDNGVVSQIADSCIGCQYCIWNCPYEVPVFNPERRIVTKCDLCLPRLEAGEAPACVAACPTGALRVERVSMAALREGPSQGDAPGLPPSSITLPTTRIILPPDLPADAEPARLWAVEPADPHWPLISLTLLTQVSVGTVTATAALAAADGPAHLGAGAAAAAGAGLAALTASVLHLGRPAHAWKALRNLRRSWLSREVALFGAFAAAAVTYALTWPVGAPEGARTVTGVVAVVLGLAGLFASARLYLVPARPMWNSPRTVVSFFATAAATGPLSAVLVLRGAHLPGGGADSLLATAGAATVVQLATYQLLAASVAARSDHGWAAFGRLLFRRFQWLLAARIACGVVAVAAIASGMASSAPQDWAVPALIAAAAGELAGRYLFYVTVVPMTADGSFFRGLR